MWIEELTGLAKSQANPHMYFEPLTMMGAAGAATERIKVGVSSPTRSVATRRCSPRRH